MSAVSSLLRSALLVIIPVACATIVSAADFAVEPNPKPAWLTDLSIGAREGYDNNIRDVSGLGLPVQTSWVSQFSFRAGADLRAILPAPILTHATLAYQPDVFVYANAPEEDCTTHRLNLSLQGGGSHVTFGLEDGFLFVDGGREGPTYAVNQLSGSSGNQFDKYRSFFAPGPSRERRRQVQDRGNAFLQYDAAFGFVRPVASLLYYNLDTNLHNTSVAPYKGYLNAPDRWDANSGVDFGWRTPAKLALTLGYRSGFQHQDQFAPDVSSDAHYSSSHYQRILFGVEGRPVRWLTLKAAAGPDFRIYNPMAPISNPHTTRPYVEASATAAVSPTQTVTFSHRQMMWLSASGITPFVDTTSAMTWHWQATSRWGFDGGAQYREANFLLGNDRAGAAPSLRDDVELEGSFGVSVILTPHLLFTVTGVYDKAYNALKGLDATFGPAYRNMTHGVTMSGLQYRY